MVDVNIYIYKRKKLEVTSGSTKKHQFVNFYRDQYFNPSYIHTLYIWLHLRGVQKWLPDYTAVYFFFKLRILTLIYIYVWLRIDFVLNIHKYRCFLQSFNANNYFVFKIVALNSSEKQCWNLYRDCIGYFSSSYSSN